MNNNPVFLAIDTVDLAQGQALLSKVKGHIGGVKLGLEFFLSHGAAGYRAIAGLDIPIFLDLKLHDIPNTVVGGLRAVLPLQPALITLHCQGGTEMMRRAADFVTSEAETLGVTRPKLIGVTVMTSLDKDDLTGMGVEDAPLAQVTRLALMAHHSGLDGIVCSPLEVNAVRQTVGPDRTLICPGIRPKSASADDQKRTMSPNEAIAAGADILVIGRPITAADDPAAAAADIAASLNASA